MKYDGIFPETLALMAQNRFENSKAFYEEHKQELKDGFTVPLCAFGNELAAAFGEGHVDAVIVGGGIFIIGADFCIAVLLLGHGIHLTGIIA